MFYVQMFERVKKDVSYQKEQKVFQFYTYLEVNTYTKHLPQWNNVRLIAICANALSGIVGSAVYLLRPV